MTLMAGLSPQSVFARKWTDSTGKHHIEAEFVEFKDGKVRLRRPDSSFVVIPIESLSETDQQFVRAVTQVQSPANNPGQSPAPAVLGETTEGTCQLKQRKAFDKDAFKVQVGGKIKGTCKFSIQDIFGKKIINANVEIVNTSDKAMHCQYYVAFFDNAGALLGCAGQGTFSDKGLAAGESTQLGSCLIPLPAGFHEKAVQYKIAFYESDKEIGTEQLGPANRKQAKKRPLAPNRDAKTSKRTGEAEKPFGSQPGSATAANGTGPRQVKWYSAGPAWMELNKVAQARGIYLRAGNHDEANYRRSLSESQPGSTFVLLFALDHWDRNIPQEYQDLLPMPWDQIEAALTKGETVERAGKARKRAIVLLAAPTESQLKELIHKTRLLSPNSPNQ
jgi:hypothetical protein